MCCVLEAHPLLQLWCCPRPGWAAQVHHCKLPAALLVVLLAPAALVRREAPACLGLRYLDGCCHHQQNLPLLLY